MSTLHDPPRSRILRHPDLCAAAQLAAHALLALLSLRQQGVTFDECAHLPAGIAYWQRGAFFVYSVNPPLSKMLAALPVVLQRPVMDYPPSWPVPASDRPESQLARRFQAANQEYYFDLFWWGRLPMIALSVLGGWAIFLWCRDLYGPGGGLVGVTLWCFCPNLLAHAGLVSPDLGAATGTALACYCYWRWLNRPAWSSALAAGVALGVAELMKFTLLLLYPCFLLSWFVWRWPRSLPEGQPKPSVLQLVALLLLSLLVINLGYGFQNTCPPLGKIDFVSKALTNESLESVPGPPDQHGIPTYDYRAVRRNRFRDTWLAHVPVPLPLCFVQGIDIQKVDLEGDKGWLSYLRGEWRGRGWWYYYLYAMAVKLPLGTLALLGLTILTLLLWPPSRLPWPTEFLVLLPLVAILTLVSSQTAFNHHMRYVLPVWPLLIVFVARSGRIFEHSIPHGRAGRAFALAVAGCLAWNVAATVRAHPHYLAYFNEAAGGSKNGGLHLIDSNFDWGQDLLRLRAWLDEHPEAQPLGVAYFNFCDPSVAGIRFDLPPPFTEAMSHEYPHESLGPHPGWFAVSATYVYGGRGTITNGRGQLEAFPPGAYAYFQRFRPVAKAGWSIFIYYISDEQADEVRQELGLRPLR